MRQITEDHLPALAIGAAILGTGGGGNPYLGMLRVRQLLRQGREIRIIAPEDLGDSDLVVTAGGMGSPTVTYEKLSQGEEEAEAVRALERHLGRRFDAIAPLEMGGGNSMAALCVGALLEIPVVDGDGMGRAFPELQMITYLIYGASPSPAALADEKGNRLVLSEVVDHRWLERIARSATIAMGGHAGLATAVMDGAHCKRSIIPHTLRQAFDIGNAVLEARGAKRNPVQAILRVTGGRRYLRGKVVDVDRRLAQGFARGHLALEGFDDDAGRQVRIDFQNENLVIWEDGEPKVTVPDLITLVTTERAEPITTEVVRYGHRADVLVLPCPPMLRTEQALAVVGPRAFGFDLDYRPAI